MLITKKKKKSIWWHGERLIKDNYWIWVQLKKIRVSNNSFKNKKLRFP